MEDIDVYRAAKQLIEQHGEDALIYAMNKETHFCQLGDTEGANTWKRIGDAVEWMQMPENLASDTVQ